MGQISTTSIKDLLSANKELAEVNIKLTQALAGVLKDLEKTDPEWISLKKAITLTGLNSNQLKYLVRTGRLRQKMEGPRTTFYLLEDINNLVNA